MGHVAPSKVRYPRPIRARTGNWLRVNVVRTAERYGEFQTATGAWASSERDGLRCLEPPARPSPPCGLRPSCARRASLASARTLSFNPRAVATARGSVPSAQAVSPQAKSCALCGPPRWRNCAPGVRRCDQRPARQCPSSGQRGEVFPLELPLATLHRHGRLLGIQTFGDHRVARQNENNTNSKKRKASSPACAVKAARSSTVGFALARNRGANVGPASPLACASR